MKLTHVPLGFFVRVSHVRHQRGWSVAEICRRMGICPRTYRSVANGRTVSAQVLERFNAWSRFVQLPPTW